MDALSDKSNALLESLVAARETERAATDEALSAHADLVVLEGRLATARQILRDWVFSVYSGGGGDADLAGMLDAMSSEPDQVGDPLGDLSYLTEQRTRALQDVKVLTAEQVRLSAAADAAEASAAEATRVIQRDKAALDKVVLDPALQGGCAAQAAGGRGREGGSGGQHPRRRPHPGGQGRGAAAARRAGLRLGRHHRDRQAVHRRHHRSTPTG